MFPIRVCEFEIDLRSNGHVLEAHDSLQRALRISLVSSVQHARYEYRATNHARSRSRHAIRHARLLAIPNHRARSKRRICRSCGERFGDRDALAQDELTEQRIGNDAALARVFRIVNGVAHGVKTFSSLRGCFGPAEKHARRQPHVTPESTHEVTLIRKAHVHCNFGSRLATQHERARTR